MRAAAILEVMPPEPSPESERPAMIEAARLDEMARQNLRIDDNMSLADDRREALEALILRRYDHPKIRFARFAMLARENAPTISTCGEKRNWSIGTTRSSR